VTVERHRPPPHARDRRIGQLIEGRYRIERAIGRGSMSTVYLAEHVHLPGKVAIKTLHRSLSDAPEVVERFRREARAAATIGDAHIARLSHTGQLEDGTYYIVMEYLDGADLGWLLASEGPFSSARTHELALQLCDALRAVHDAGITHRDLKPENLFITQRHGGRDHLKILDFGICKFHGHAAQALPRLTATAVAMGTPHYMAPEQIDASRALDHRADIYAVGANLYFTLTGQPPFDARSLPTLFQRIRVDPVPDVRALRPDVSTAFAEVVARALAKRPEDRFADVRQLRAALIGVPVSEERPRPSFGRSSVNMRRPLPPVAADPAYERTLMSGLPPAAPVSPRRQKRLGLAGIMLAAAVSVAAWAQCGALHREPASRPTPAVR